MSFLGFPTKKHSLVLDFPSGKHCFSCILDGFGVIPLGFPREDLDELACKTYVILGFCRDNVFFTIVHGLRVIVFGFPKKNLQYFERRLRHLAFFQGINLLPYILDFASFAWFDPRETLFSLHLGRIWCDLS